MALQVVLTIRAKRNLDKIITYVHSEFGEKVTAQLKNRISETVDLIAEHPEMGTFENKERNIRGFLIRKQLRLFYRVDKTRLILLNFFDTRQHPKKKLK